MPLASPINTQNGKIGTCPHGMPMGACPICNGMSGGNSTTKRDIPRNPGEMTYNECLAMGAMLKAIKNARQQAQNAEQNRLQSIAKFHQTMDKATQKLAQLSEFFSKHTPSVISKPMNFILNKIAGKTLNFMRNVPNMFANFGQKFADISDKLAAVFGEKKAAFDKKFSEFSKKTKEKLKSIFFIFGANETEDEEKKIEEAKRIFDLKRFIQKLINNKKDLVDDENSDIQ